MRRRIVEAIVGVAAAILLALGLPLAIAAHRTIVDSEVVELQAAAAHTLVDVDLPFDRAQLQRVATEPEGEPPFSIYDEHGERLFGKGPAAGDSPVNRALAGATASSTDGELVVATPITDRSSKRIVGALRVTESLAEVDHRSRVVWLRMLSVGLVALLLGWLVARRLARQLSLPLTDLVAAAASIGDGGAFTQAPLAGIAEIDSLAGAFAQSSLRVSAALGRERRFSADVSHQLRTPLTRLRLRLENTPGVETAAAGRTALEELTHVEQTIDHLLALARDAMPASSTVRLDLAIVRAVARWEARAGADGRAIRVVSDATVAVRGAAASVDQILDVLVENALQHGSGSITLLARHLTGGGAIDVADEGAGVATGDEERIFDRRVGRGNGIGLALARSLAEAEGGRLLLVQARPARLSLILTAAYVDDDDEAP